MAWEAIALLVTRAVNKAQECPTARARRVEERPQTRTCIETQSKPRLKYRGIHCKRAHSQDEEGSSKIQQKTTEFDTFFALFSLNFDALVCGPCRPVSGQARSSHCKRKKHPWSSQSSIEVTPRRSAGVRTQHRRHHGITKSPTNLN